MFRILLPSFLSLLGCLAAAAGASAQTQAQTPQQPTVYCWKSSVNQPGLTPMVWVQTDTSTPEKAAQHAIAAMNRLPEGQRGLFLWHFGRNPRMIDPRRVYDIVRDGSNVEPLAKWMQTFYRKLKEADVLPDRVILDYEAGLTVWHIGQPNTPRSRILMPIFNDVRTYTKLPASVTQYSPSDFDGGPRGRQATMAWNQYADQLVTGYLRQATYDTAIAVFGRTIPTTNYQDGLYTFDAHDLNGWPQKRAAIGTESSPVMYLHQKGQRYPKWQKDPRWNRFIDNLNSARSAIARGPVVPWLSYPSYNGDDDLWGGSKWLWAEQVKHLNQMGISNYLLWNPWHYGKTLTDPSLMDDQFTSQIFTALKLPARAPTTQPITYAEIPLDANQVTTGGITTRYSDYMASLNPTGMGLPMGAAGPLPMSSSANATPTPTPTGTRIYVPGGNSASSPGNGNPSSTGPRVVRRAK